MIVGARFGVEGLWLSVEVLRFRVQGLGMRVEGVRFRVDSLGEGFRA